MIAAVLVLNAVLLVSLVVLWQHAEQCLSQVQADLRYEKARQGQTDRCRRDAYRLLTNGKHVEMETPFPMVEAVFHQQVEVLVQRRIRTPNQEATRNADILIGELHDRIHDMLDAVTGSGNDEAIEGLRRAIDYIRLTVSAIARSDGERTL